MLASVAHSVPPRSYGPWEQVASTLTEGLVQRGHDVTLFATADSVTAAALHAEAPAGYEEDDSVEAKVLKRDKDGVTLQITNPTRFDARVAVLAENAKQAQHPLGPIGFLTWPKVLIKAGATTQITLK